MEGEKKQGQVIRALYPKSLDWRQRELPADENPFPSGNKDIFVFSPVDQWGLEESHLPEGELHFLQGMDVRYPDSFIGKVNLMEPNFDESHAPILIEWPDAVYLVARELPIEVQAPYGSISEGFFHRQLSVQNIN